MSEPLPVVPAGEPPRHGVILTLVAGFEAALARRLAPILADSTRPWPELNPSSPLQPPESAYAFLGYDALRYYLRLVRQLQDGDCPIRHPNALETLISPSLRQAYQEFCHDFGVPAPTQSRTMLRLQTGLDYVLQAASRGRLARILRPWSRRRTLKPHFLAKPGPEPELDPSSPIQPKPETLARLCRASRVVYLGYVKELQERKGELWWEFPHSCVSRLIPGFWAGHEAFYRDFWPNTDDDQRLTEELEQLSRVLRNRGS